MNPDELPLFMNEEQYYFYIAIGIIGIAIVLTLMIVYFVRDYKNKE